MSTAPPVVNPDLAEAAGKINAEISKFEQATLAEANNVGDIQPDRMAAFTKAVKEEVEHIGTVMRAEISRATNSIQTKAKSIIQNFEPPPPEATERRRPDEKPVPPPSHKPDDKPDRPGDHPSQLPSTPKKNHKDEDEEEEAKEKKHGWLGGAKK